jgi:hypothetical protein
MTDSQPRFRSPPYPYIGVGRAISRSEQLYNAVRNHAAALPTAAKAWDTGPKSSATMQTVGALIQYGLLTDDGSGGARRIKLTPLALKIVMDKRPSSAERDEAEKQAVLMPKVFAELFEQYGTADDIDDALLIHELTAERVQRGKAPFSDQSAADVLRVYRDSILYTGLSDSDKESDEGPVSDGFLGTAHKPEISVGDYVQWVSTGVAQFTEATRVRAISDDGDWAFVEGSKTGVPMSELEILQRPKAGRSAPTLPLPEDEPTVHDRADPRDKDRMKVVWEGSLIHISATVDKAGLDRLRKKLDAMETLLSDD